MLEVQASVFDVYGESICESEGFTVKFQIMSHREVFAMFKYNVYSLFFAYFKEQNVFKKCFV